MSKIKELFGVEIGCLTNDERKHLKEFCNPKFTSSKIKFINKRSTGTIYLILENNDLAAGFFDIDKKTMYVGMEEDKNYTLDQLGIHFNKEETENE